MNIGPHRTTGDSATGHRDDARAKELNNLRLALATFALQLDAFEMRTRKQPFRTGTTGWNAGPAARYRLQTSERKVSDFRWKE